MVQCFMMLQDLTCGAFVGLMGLTFATGWRAVTHSKAPAQLGAHDQEVVYHQDVLMGFVLLMC
jgi:hypothetical protein